MHYILLKQLYENAEKNTWLSDILFLRRNKSNWKKDLQWLQSGSQTSYVVARWLILDSVRLEPWLWLRLHQPVWCLSQALAPWGFPLRLSYPLGLGWYPHRLPGGKQGGITRTNLEMHSQEDNHNKLYTCIWFKGTPSGEHTSASGIWKNIAILRPELDSDPTLKLSEHRKILLVSSQKPTKLTL